MVGMRTVKLFSLPMAAEVEEVLLLLTSLAMVAAEEALAAQEVKVLVLLVTVGCRPAKGPRRETG